MLSYVSYPRDHYGEFNFRMKFESELDAVGGSS